MMIIYFKTVDEDCIAMHSTVLHYSTLNCTAVPVAAADISVERISFPQTRTLQSSPLLLSKMINERH